MMVTDVDQPAAQSSSPSSIVRRFLSWAQQADVIGRAQAASALARAYLFSDLSAALRREAEMGLASLLDDNSALVRCALAEALAGASNAPHHIVLALACDQSEVSSVVLARSPILTDADLVDCFAIGDVRAQTAVARRPRLGVSVAAAIAEIGAREAVIALARNLDADLTEGVLFRIFERCGGDAQVRESLLMRPSLPSTLRCDLTAAAARALFEFVAGQRWLSPERAERITREEAEQGVVSIAGMSENAEMRVLARHLRHRGGLTIALLMRALLSGNRALIENAFAELSGLPSSRIGGFLREPQSAGFAALFDKVGLPAHFLPVFRAALAEFNETSIPCGDRMSWSLTRRVIAACDNIQSLHLDELMSLLRRFEAETAREEARLFAAESSAHRPPARLLVDFDEWLADDQRATASTSVMRITALAEAA